MMSALDAVEERVLGFECGADDYLVKPSLGNSIDVHIANLRRKVDSPEAKLIHTVRGAGFMVSEIAPPGTPRFTKPGA